MRGVLRCAQNDKGLGGVGTRTDNSKGKNNSKKQMRGFFASLRMTRGWGGWDENRQQQGKNNSNLQMRGFCPFDFAQGQNDRL